MKLSLFKAIIPFIKIHCGLYKFVGVSTFMNENAIINDMGNTPSYLDWESNFKSKKKKKKEQKLTSIGINEKELKNFLKNWKLNNLPVKKQK